ncbi:MAG: hypothetical protein QOH33_2016, partial [Paraburkholderia sp.]|nr:hypothetical protein [Paraburkholderia sp.]
MRAGSQRKAFTKKVRYRGTPPVADLLALEDRGLNEGRGLCYCSIPETPPPAAGARC